MSQDIKLSLSSGNSKTYVIEDATAAKYFWSDYFTHCYEANNDHFVFENSFDLMGNPIPKSIPPRKHHKEFSKK